MPSAARKFLSSEMCSKTPTAATICSLARKGMASHTSGALTPSGTARHQGTATASEQRADGWLWPWLCTRLSLAARRHVAARTWRVSTRLPRAATRALDGREARTDGLRASEREADPVGVHAVANKASHRDAAVLDLRVADPPCWSGARAASASGVRLAGVRLGDIQGAAGWLTGYKLQAVAHRSRPPGPASTAAGRRGQWGRSSQSPGSAPWRALPHKTDHGV